MVVHRDPGKPTITQSGSLLTSSIATGYQWYLNGNLISGAQNQDYTITGDGKYIVEITDSNGCSAFSNEVNITTAVKSYNSPFYNLRIFPNPSSGWIYLDTRTLTDKNFKINIYNVFGTHIKTYDRNDQVNINILNIAKLPTGIYILEIQTKTSRFYHRIVRSN